MTKTMLRGAAVATAVAAMAAGTAGAVTPVNGGDPGGSIVTINNGLGDQTEPRVSGDLAVYTNNDGGVRTIRYFDFVTGVGRVVPVGAIGDSDVLSDVAG